MKEQDMQSLFKKEIMMSIEMYIKKLTLASITTWQTILAVDLSRSSYEVSPNQCFLEHVR